MIMKQILMLAFILLAGVNEMCLLGQNSIDDYKEFESCFPLERYSGNPIMVHGKPWAGGQLQEPCILVNPKDSTKLIMIYAGMNLIKDDGGRGAIFKAWAHTSNPYKWYDIDDGPIITPDSSILYENKCIRMDCLLYNEETDEYWVYYTGRNNDNRDVICLAICPVGKDGYTNVNKNNFKKYEGNPVLTAAGQGRNDGTHVSQSAVLKEDGMYYMFYSYRDGDGIYSGKDLILPGIRYATSTDGKEWIKKGAGNILSRGVQGGPDTHYFEYKQVFKAFDKNIMIWEAFNGKEWSVCMASSDSPEGPWVKSSINPIFRPSGDKEAFDEMFVATPTLNLINDKWHLFYQGAKNGGDYNYNTWDLGVAVLHKK